MRVRWYAVVVAALAGVGPSAAQPATGLPPLALLPDGDPFPAGTPVSCPLQPVLPESLGPDPSPDQALFQRPSDLDGPQTRPLPDVWADTGLLVWWPKAQPVPPLATNPGGTALGGAALTTRPSAGGRFVFGAAVNDARTVGAEVTYLFLDGRTGAGVADQPAGAVAGATTTRLVGWEATAIGNLFADPALRLDALAGYRYFQLNEGLAVDRAGGRSQTSADEFDAHTRFHGGQLGLRADAGRGPVFLELVGKFGLGQSVEVVRVGGESAGPAGGVVAGGVLARPGNSGRFVRTGFAVLPEAAVKLGYSFRPASRVYVGYDFLYLSSAARPGDQIDRLVGTPADRPFGPPARTDFWAQGLLFGLEYRY